MEQLTDQEPPETDARPLAHAEKCRLARLLLKLSFSDQWAPPGSFLRSHIAHLDHAIRNADVQAAKGRKQRAQRRDDEHDDE